MAVINIPASKRLTISNKPSCCRTKDNKITIGNDGGKFYHSYLFFDTSCIPNCILILSATLVLFKLADFFDYPFQKFTVYPLVKEISSCSTYESSCHLDRDPVFKQDFRPFTRDVAIEIDITPIVTEWVNNTLANRGIMIKDTNTNPSITCYTSFGSAYSKDNTLIPFIRIEIKQGPCICFLPQSNLTYTATPVSFKREK